MTTYNEQNFESQRFFTSKYRKVLSLVTLLSFSACVLAIVFSFQMLHRQPIQYYASTVQGRVIPLKPLVQPIIPDEYILSWSGDVSRKIYTMNFSQVMQNLAGVPSFFTKNGWNSFVQSLKDSHTIETIIAKKLVTQAVVSGPIVILRKGFMSSSYCWRVQVPLMITYTSASQNIQKFIYMTMLVKRVSTLESDHGIAIDQVAISKMNNQQQMSA